MISTTQPSKTLFSVSKYIDTHCRQLMIIAFVMGWLFLYGPIYLTFSQTIWTRDENTHAPFILAICIGLIFAQLSSGRLQPHRTRSEFLVGSLTLVTGLLACAWSRIQEVDLVLSASQIPVAAGALVMIFGIQSVRQMWFIFALSFYLVTWPGWAIDMLTFPLKMMVSDVVANGLYSVGLPVTHDGAVINAGVYELLVADACAGMNSLIALTSIGVVYLYIMRRPLLVSNIITLLLLAPIAIFANIIRVAMLVMITLFWGYDAGQSFLHDLSGLVMFAAALSSVFSVEAVIFWLTSKINLMRGKVGHD